MAGLQMIVFMKGGKSRAQPPPGKELMAGPRLYSVTMALPAIIESDRENSDWIEFSGSEPVIEIVKERNGKGGVPQWLPTIRSEERRGGKECVSKCRTRGS